MKLSRALLIMLLPIAASTVVRSETGDPAGYVTWRLLAGEKGAMALSLVKDYKVVGSVTAVGSDYVEYATDLPADLKGNGNSAFLEIRTGAGAGVTLPVTGFSGKRVTLGRSPVGLIVPGNKAGVRPDWTIGELFVDPVNRGIVTGESPETADTVGVFNPQTQSMKIYYFKTDAGWREAGRESEGDKANAPVPFPNAPVFQRRANTDLNYLLIGAVPMPYEGRRKVYVWPGRNLITSPYTSVTRIGDWLDESSLESGSSAPKSDSMQLCYWEGGESPVVYYRKNKGWRFVGVDGDASATRVELYQAIDFQRVGQAGYLDFNAVIPMNQRALQALSQEKVVPIDPAKSDFVGGLVGWSSSAGKKYQLQIQGAGTSAWQNHGEVVTADGDITRSLCRPSSGNGLIRVLELP